MKIIKDYQIHSNYFFVKKETFRQKKLSRKKHGKRNQKWQDKATQKMAIGRKMRGDSQECLDK